jgi:hypothetical protein
VEKKVIKPVNVPKIVPIAKTTIHLENALQATLHVICVKVVPMFLLTAYEPPGVRYIKDPAKQLPVSISSGQG